MSKLTAVAFLATTMLAGAAFAGGESMERSIQNTNKHVQANAAFCTESGFGRCNDNRGVNANNWNKVAMNNEAEFNTTTAHFKELSPASGGIANSDRAAAKY